MSYVDRKSTRLNSSHAEIYTLSLHDALPICKRPYRGSASQPVPAGSPVARKLIPVRLLLYAHELCRSEEHTSELQSRRDLHSFPTRRSSDLQTPLPW